MQDYLTRSQRSSATSTLREPSASRLSTNVNSRRESGLADSSGCQRPSAGAAVWLSSSVCRQVVSTHARTCHRKQGSRRKLVDQENFWPGGWEGTEGWGGQSVRVRCSPASFSNSSTGTASNPSLLRGSGRSSSVILANIADDHACS